MRTTEKEIIHIENTDASIKEYNGQRVVTFKDIDAVHERPDGTARKAFWRNKNHFIEREDYFVLDQSMKCGIARRKERIGMKDVLEMLVPKDEQEEIREFVSTILILPKEDRAILLSNANAFKVRRDIEKAKK